jgi:thiamine pyrophosphate-dependent acetolactate synthase large subunit-like protein
VIVNDRCLGEVKANQRYRGMPDYNLDLYPVDFAEVARSCGLNGVTVETPEEFRKQLKLAFEAERTTLINALVESEPFQDSFVATLGLPLKSGG